MLPKNYQIHYGLYRKSIFALLEFASINLASHLVR